MPWVLTNPLSEPGWDDLVMTHPRHTFFHGAAWARVLHDTYGAQPFYWVHRGEFQLRELLPVIELNSTLAGLRAVSLPFTDECGPLQGEGTATGEMFELLQQAGIDRGWHYWEGRGDWSFTPPYLTFWGHCLNIERESGRNFMGFNPAMRRAIRKAEKEGLSVKVECSTKAMKVFFELHCQTRQKHGVPPQPAAFFANIHRHVMARDAGFLVVASLGDQPVAAAMFFVLGNRAVFKFGASASKFLALRGNNLVMWEAIRELSRRGVESLDFGRTSKSNEGLRRYKSGFGACERLISCCRYDFHARSFVTGKDRAQGWHNYVFRALPRPVLRLAGHLIYRHLN